jgi:hypothetical protein
MGIQQESCVRPDARWERSAADWVRTGVYVPGSNVQELRLLRSEPGASAVGSPWKTCACTYALVTVLPWYPLTHHLCVEYMSRWRGLSNFPISVAHALRYAYLRQLASAKEKVRLLLLFCFHRA